MSITNTPAVTTALYEQPIEGATGGFGMYQATANSGDDKYLDISDLVAASEFCAYVYTGHEGWEQDEDAELVEAIREVTGSCYNEPTYLLAYRHENGVIVTGINTLDCYELEDGDLVAVKEYEANPERYALA